LKFCRDQCGVATAHLCAIASMIANERLLGIGMDKNGREHGPTLHRPYDATALNLVRHCQTSVEREDVW
jgi:hypothetical protein